MRASPERVAHFRILAPLGAGGMGVVYRAHDERLDRNVALKLIRPERTADPHARARFLRECRAAAAVSHPGIATLLEAGETEDHALFLVSELVEGENLVRRIERGAMPAEQAIGLGVQLADALATAHARGVIHRDIKPANLMLTPEGRLKVLDFGVARRLHDGDPDPLGTEATASLSLTRTGARVGTPAYTSPEQAAGLPGDERSDVFSAGCVLYELTCGRRAFRGESVEATLHAVATSQPPPLEKMARRVPREFGRIIRSTLAKDPAERCGSAARMAAELRRLQGRMAHRTRRLIGAAAMVLLAITATSLWWSRRAPLGFTPRDSILIADVDNRTNEETFDLALQTALEADLRQSRYATVFDRGQVAEVLRLMRRDPATRLDEALGRDVCRFAGVRALVLPRILAVGQAYELQAVLVDPIDGKHVESFRVSARGAEDVLLRAIDDLSRKLRRGLGESMSSIRRTDAPVAMVTTSSWEALRLYTLAHQRWSAGHWQDAATMFEKALDKDPRFVAARLGLGLAQIQFLGRVEEGKKTLARAVEDSQGLSERELLLVRAVELQYVKGDLQAALEQYRLAGELYPEMWEPHNSRGVILRQLGRFGEAAQAFETAARIAPHMTVPLGNLYFLDINPLRDPERAEQVARRMVEMGPEIAAFHAGLGWALAAQGRFDESLTSLRRALELEPKHPLAYPNLAHVLLASGRAVESVPIYRDILEFARSQRKPWVPSAARDLCFALLQSGEITAAREVARAALRDQDESSSSVAPSAEPLLERAQLEVCAGLTAEAERRIEQARSLPIDQPSALLDLAAALAMLGRRDEAMTALERCLAAGYPDPFLPRVSPPFHELLDEPRFRALFRAGPLEKAP